VNGALPAFPIWLVALVAAGLAPYAVSLIEQAMQRRVRRRTLTVLARAGVPQSPPVAAARDSSQRSRKPFSNFSEKEPEKQSTPVS
jgi:hypothetical protein